MLKEEYVLRGRIAGSGGLVGPPGPQGEPGKDGKDGYTPVKGVDYYTEAEKAELIDEIEVAVNGKVTAISVTEATDGTVTMVNTLDDGSTETIVITSDANGNPSGLSYNGVAIPLTWTEAAT